MLTRGVIAEISRPHPAVHPHLSLFFFNRWCSVPCSLIAFMPFNQQTNFLFACMACMVPLTNFGVMLCVDELNRAERGTLALPDPAS